VKIKVELSSLLIKPSTAHNAFVGTIDSYVQVFTSKVNKLETGCWEWKNCVDDIGYGTLTLKNRSFKAHHLSYLLFNGDINTSFVLHTCDKRNCVNPQHLFLGSQLDNMKDCAQKGRIVTTPKLGEDNSRSVLTEANVLEMIKVREQTKLSYSKLAKLFNCSTMTACRVCNRKLWKHI